MLIDTVNKVHLNIYVPQLQERLKGYPCEIELTGWNPQNSEKIVVSMNDKCD